MKLTKRYLRSWVWILVVVLPLGIAVWACDLDDDDLSVHVSSHSDLCGEIAEVMCANMFQCCTESEIQQALDVITDVSERECNRDMRLYCEERFATLLYSMENGSVSLDKNAINSCLSALLVSDNSCIQVEMDPEWQVACLGIEFFQGNRGIGESCFWDFECVPDSYCSAGMTCKELPGLNEDCSVLPCAANYYCGYNYAYDLVCQEYRELDEECSLNPGDGMLCDPETMYCEDWDSSNSATGWCVEKKGLGVTCAGNHECESNQCAPGYCEGYESDSCYEDDECWYYGGGCVGEIVCVDDPVVSDYCSLGVSLFYFFPDFYDPYDY